MLSTLYRVTVILLLCLFSSACCLWGCTIPSNTELPQKPKWAIDRVPPDWEEGAIGCSRCFAISQQEKRATRAAITKLAEQKGVEIDSKLHMRETESSSAATMVTIQGTKEKIKVKTYQIWSHPAGIETCVWMKEMK